jgi:hypothetical protein
MMARSNDDLPTWSAIWTTERTAVDIAKPITESQKHWDIIIPTRQVSRFTPLSTPEGQSAEDLSSKCCLQRSDL